MELHWLPTVAPIERKIDTGFGARIEQSLPRGIFADDASDHILREAGHDLLPGLTGVTCAIDIRSRAAPSSRRDHISSLSIDSRSLDQSDIAARGQLWRRDIIPGRAVVAGELHETTVRAHPNLSRLRR